MGLWVPVGSSEFGWSVSNIDGVTPTEAFGVAVTPQINTKGNWFQILSSALVSEDVFGLLINFNYGFVNGTARDMLSDVGVDPAGGSSYSVLIPNLYMCSPATYEHAGQSYYFPIWVRAGSSIAVRTSVNSLNTNTVSCWIRAFGRPRDPRMVKVGTYVDAYGAVPSTSTGTLVTPGTVSEGAWTSLGTISREAWWWQQGMGQNTGSMGLRWWSADLGIGDLSNKHVVIRDQLFSVIATNEQLASRLAVNPGYKVSSGNVYARLQASSSGGQTPAMVAYGLGG